MQNETAIVSRNEVGMPHTVAPSVTGLQILMVNVYLVGRSHGGLSHNEWVLIDTGMPLSADRIRQAADERFGRGARPAAILLTHGHFDHVGTVQELAESWDVPVYAHPLELPYLTGRSSYPPPDPTVGGGSMAILSPLYPKGPIDLGRRVKALPQDGSVPGLPGWRWIHTPGHTPGHVSFFRDVDRTLIAGDAFVTTKQESLLAVLSQRLEMHGPPMYFTPDWESAQRSVEELAALRPNIMACGHGLPVQGSTATQALDDLARDFRSRAMPSHGRYVDRPARADERGVVSVPPMNWGPILLAGAVVTAALGIAIGLSQRQRA